jgi:hypothetical protein
VAFPETGVPFGRNGGDDAASGAGLRCSLERNGAGREAVREASRRMVVPSSVEEAFTGLLPFFALLDVSGRGVTWRERCGSSWGRTGFDEGL